MLQWNTADVATFLCCSVQQTLYTEDSESGAIELTEISDSGHNEKPVSYNYS